MRFFDRITEAYDAGNYAEVCKIREVLKSELEGCVYGRERKYRELIVFCIFLSKYRNAPAEERLNMASRAIHCLELSHELGRCINERIMAICV